MQGRKTEAFGMLNHHAGSIGYINANFDNTCGYQKVQTTLTEIGHDASFLFFINPGMNQGGLEFGKYLI